MVAVVRSAVRSWTLTSGEALHTGKPLGGFKVYGSAQNQTLFAAQGFVPGTLGAGGNLSSGGFVIAGRVLSYRQLRALPTSAAGILQLARRDRQQVVDAASLISQILTAPVNAAVRAAAFGALAQVPGWVDLGTVDDPLGRAGVALAHNSSQTLRGETLYERTELIFDEHTGALLSDETLVLNPPDLAGLPRPLVMAATSYVSSRVLSASSLSANIPPSLAQALAALPKRLPAGAKRLPQR